MAKDKRIVVHFAADYKDTEEIIDGFKEALERFGIKVYDDPNCEGTDTYGFLLSNEELTDDQVKELTDLS